MRIAGAALLAVVVAITQQQVAAQWNPPWRPSYYPFSSGYTVNNGTLFITLLYDNWQGYFNNRWTMPTGRLPSSIQLFCAWTPQVASPCEAGA